MKNYLKLSIACLVVVAFIIYMKANRTVPHSSLVLNNIEALAANEGDNVFCFGIGTVDCPIDHSKVKYVFEPYSLGW